MRYLELIKRVQKYSGLSKEESKEALQVLVESLSVHLTEAERLDFASQLPAELKGMALAVLATEKNSKEDILYQYMYFQNVDEGRAKKQIKAVWRAIKDAISGGEIKDVQSQLPKKTLTLLG